MLIQFVLGHMPFGEQLNYRLQKLNGSRQNEQKMRRRMGELTASLKQVDKQVPIEGATVVEVGTGWEPICSLILYLMGAKACHTYDHVVHVRHELVEFLLKVTETSLPEIAEASGIPVSVLAERLEHLNGSSDLDEYFRRANIVYHAPGDATKTGLPDSSVDLYYSHAVLEHVPEKVVVGLMEESSRVLKPEGRGYHLIGLHDHYISADKKISKINFLKYSEFWWSFFVKNRISYHNRFREKQYLDIVDNAGGTITWKNNTIDPSDLELLKTMKVDKMFDGMSHEELAVTETEFLVSF